MLRTTIDQEGRRPGRLGDAGQTLAEFALVMLVLGLLIMGIVDFGRAVFARSAITAAAREGARFAIVNITIDASPEDKAAIEDDVIAAAKSKLAGLDDSALEVAVTYASAAPTGVEVEVSVTYTFHAITPLIGQLVEGPGGTGLVQTAHSVMLIERREDGE